MTDRNAMIRQNEPSLVETAQHALDLARRVAVDELRLLQMESLERIESTARRSGWVLFGAVCLLIAWVALLATAVVMLEGRVSLELRLLGVAASQLVIGAGLLAYGLRGGRNP